MVSIQNSHVSGVPRSRLRRLRLRGGPKNHLRIVISYLDVWGIRPCAAHTGVSLGYSTFTVLRHCRFFTIVPFSELPFYRTWRIVRFTVSIVFDDGRFNDLPISSTRFTILPFVPIVGPVGLSDVNIFRATGFISLPLYQFCRFDPLVLTPIPFVLIAGPVGFNIFCHSMRLYRLYYFTILAILPFSAIGGCTIL